MLDGLDEQQMINNEGALTCESYRAFLIYYITYFTSAENSFNKFTDYSVSFNRKLSYASAHLSGNSFKYWLSKYLYDECEKLNPETIKSAFAILARIDNKNVLSEMVNNHCKKWINKKPEPKLAESGTSDFPFKLKGLDGKEHQLADFKGKVIYIDFWASWCGPCRQQFPFAKELHKKFSEKQLKEILFLYISIDNTEDVWKNAIEQNQLEGYHLISPGGWDSQVVRSFKINSIPRYMLIDKKGKVSNPDAKRPSSEEIQDDILKLLK